MASVWSPEHDRAAPLGGGPLSRQLYARLDSIRSAGGISALGTSARRDSSVDVGPSPPPRAMSLPDPASPSPSAVQLPPRARRPSAASEGATGDDRHDESAVAASSVARSTATGGALSPPGIRPTKLEALADKRTPPAARRPRGGPELGDRPATIVAVSPVLSRRHVTRGAHEDDDAAAAGRSSTSPAPAAVVVGDVAASPARISRMPAAAAVPARRTEVSPPLAQRQTPTLATPKPHATDIPTRERNNTWASSPAFARGHRQAADKQEATVDDSPVPVRFQRLPVAERDAVSAHSPAARHESPMGTHSDAPPPAVPLPAWPASRSASPPVGRPNSGRAASPHVTTSDAAVQERLTAASLQRLQRLADAREAKRAASVAHHATQTLATAVVEGDGTTNREAPAVELTVTCYSSVGDARAAYVRSLRRRGAAPLPPSVCRHCGATCDTDIDSLGATLWFCDACGARLVHDSVVAL